MLPSAWRKLLLVIHVVTSVGFIGAVAGFLALAITGATTTDQAIMRGVYISMAVLTWDVVVPLAVASLVIGILQSLGTPWGLFRYYWIIIKLVLTVLAAVVLMLQTQTINALAGAALAGNVAQFSEARLSMIVHGTGGLLVLLVATVLSVYKPRGMTNYGARLTT
jgi:hypothetical protein